MNAEPTNQYTMITKNNCPWCEKAEALFKERGLGYVKLNIDDNLLGPSYRKILKRDNLKTVPQIYNGFNLIGGYTDFKAYVDGLEN